MGQGEFVMCRGTGVPGGGVAAGFMVFHERWVWFHKDKKYIFSFSVG